MSPKARSPRAKSDVAKGNFVSEWFGHRTYPVVASSREALRDQQSARCPFLSEATREKKLCIKPQPSSGVCTISSPSNGPRQDWLVCPYRAIGGSLLEATGRRLFGIEPRRKVVVLAGPALSKPDVRDEFKRALASGDKGIVFLQDKLGGEISLSPTDSSPAVSFDITMIEIGRSEGRFVVQRFGILEVQTMDYHGSYRHAVGNLKDAQRLHKASFPKVLQDHPQWLSDHIEGPNIANVFKRTLYQIMIKFQIGSHGTSAGCVLAVPLSVWDSWQRHLGRPKLLERSDGTFLLQSPRGELKTRQVRAWVYVFDLDVSAGLSPNPIRIKKVIGTSAESLAHYAFKIAPEVALASGGSADGLLSQICNRLHAWWPELSLP